MNSLVVRSTLKRGYPFAFAAALLALTASPQAAQAQTTISTLFNTGVNNSNVLLAGGVADTHYTMIANNIGLTNNTSALVNTDQLVGTWAQNATSKYISPDGADGSISGGNYVLTYRTTFTLPVNTVLSSVVINGSWSTDNTGTNILINGNSTGISSSTFTSFTSFSLPTTFYQTGTNTLDFVWSNVGGPGGLNVFYTTKTFATASAPEPASLALTLVGFVGTAGLVTRRKSRRA